MSAAGLLLLLSTITARVRVLEEQWHRREARVQLPANYRMGSLACTTFGRCTQPSLQPHLAREAGGNSFICCRPTQTHTPASFCSPVLTNSTRPRWTPAWRD